jgi:transposase-like protein
MVGQWGAQWRMASKEEKRRICEGYATSGMTRREYGAKHGIAVSTLDYWRSKRKAKLVRVTVEEQPPGPGFTLTLANGRRIESSWRFAEADLERLIRTAES